MEHSNNQPDFDDLQYATNDADHSCNAQCTRQCAFAVYLKPEAHPLSVDDEIVKLLAMFRPKTIPPQAMATEVETDAPCNIVLPPPTRFNRNSRKAKPAISEQ